MKQPGDLHTSLSLLQLLLLLSASLLSTAVSAATVPQSDAGSIKSADCSVAQRPSLVDALNELFTCLLEKHVESTEIHRLAGTIDFRGISGSGVTQKPLLSDVYSLAGVLAAGESYQRYYDVATIFNPELGVDEIRGPAELAKLDDYLGHLERSPLVRDAYATLRANRAIDRAITMSQFVRGTLYDHWFKLYARTSKAHQRGLRESSGFGHVFVGEVRDNSVTGFHSWLQLLLAEANGTFEYKGYVRVSQSPVLIGGLQFDWLGRAKSLSSFMFGVPPEFELALYSACFIANPGRKTILSIKGKPVSVQTHYVYHQQESVATAYPVV